MQNHNSYEYGRREFRRSPEENGAIALTILIIGAIALVLYILVARFHIRLSQLVELRSSATGFGRHFFFQLGQNFYKLLGAMTGQTTP